MAHPGEPPMYDLNALQLTLARQEKIIASIQGQLQHAIGYKFELMRLIEERLPLPDTHTKPPLT